MSRPLDRKATHWMRVNSFRQTRLDVASRDRARDQHEPCVRSSSPVNPAVCLKSLRPWRLSAMGGEGRPSLLRARQTAIFLADAAGKEHPDAETQRWKNIGAHDVVGTQEARARRTYWCRPRHKETC